jgi:ATP-dependent Clp protease ATP-binding subunit ClpA
MARLIEDKIKKPLAEALIFGNLEQGGAVAVRRSADGKSLELDLPADAVLH